MDLCFVWKQFWNIYKYRSLHVVLWACVWLFYIYFFSYATQDLNYVFWFASSLLPVTMGATYLYAYHIIPQYLFEKKYRLFALYSVYCLIAVLYFVLLVTFLNFMLQSNFSLNEMPLLTRNFIFVFILVFLVVALVSFSQLLKHNYQQASRNSALENQLLEGELKLKEKELFYLKQHIHPHFLFNTLNTIYGAALKKSDQTPELILKLSNLLDYTLNQIDKPLIGISEEIKYIEAYVGLEEVRFSDSLQVHFKKQLDCEVQIPPMLLMTFVENAFKHGGARDGIFEITIELIVQESQLKFLVKNSLSKTRNMAAGHGLGKELVKKRLDASFPERYQLEYREAQAHYISELIIKTRTNV